MFLGHYAVAFGSKRIAPDVNLGVLILAAQFIDLLWPIFLLLGIEHVRIAPGITRMTPLDFYDYPWSHSLLMTLVWSALVAVIYGLWSNRWRSAMIVGAAVLSHWVLDFITHRPDLPLTPRGATMVGLRLWDSVPASVALELALWVTGVALYISITRAPDRRGRVSLWAVVGFLSAIFVGNLIGPLPPDVKVIAQSALSLWLLPIAGWWIDSRRELRVRNAS